MIIIVFCCLITGLQIVTSEGSSVCMADCTSLLTPRPPSLYEQYCCIPSNSGKTFTDREKNRVKIIFCPSTIPTSCNKYTFSYSSCNDLLQAFPVATSGYYSLTLSNGSIITVYCDMEGSNCDNKGGWMRVGYLNMSESGTSCPPGLTLQQYNNIDHDLCGQPFTNTSGCYSTFFGTFESNYSNVCGQIRGYQFGVPESFIGNTIDSYYLHGVSITYGESPRRHIWSYSVGTFENELSSSGCPCNNGSTGFIPSFVGDDYYCESAASDVFAQFVLYANDPLWDGKSCNGLENTCCANPKLPWFFKALNDTTTDDIELRVCSSYGLPDEGSPLDIIELYVK